MSVNNESWYSEFVNPVMHKLMHEKDCKLVKLGPINISKASRCGYNYFYLGMPNSADKPD